MKTMKLLSFGAMGTAMFGFTACGGDDTPPPVAPKPVAAGISLDKEKVNTGEEVTFASTDNTNVTSWAWTFEGGTPATSDLQSPKVSYANAGQFDVRLIVKSATHADTIDMDNAVTAMPGNGLVALYPLDNNSGTDIVGGFNATLLATNKTTDHRGKADAAMKLDKNGKIELHNFDISKPYTCAFWFKKDKINEGAFSWDRFFAKRADCGNSKFIEMYGNSSAENYRINFEYSIGEGQTFTNMATINYGTWVYIVVTYSDNKFNLYVNNNAGITATVSPAAGGAADFTNTIELGFSNTACYGTDASANRVEGIYVNNFRFYNRALTASEVKLLYDFD